MNVLLDKPVIKEEKVPFEVIEVCCEVEIGCKDVSMKSSNGSNITTQFTPSLAPHYDKNVVKKHLGREQCNVSGIESYNVTDTYDLENVKGGAKPSAILVQNRLQKVINDQSKSIIRKVKDYNNNNIFKKVVLPNEVLPAAIKAKVANNVVGGRVNKRKHLGKNCAFDTCVADNEKSKKYCYNNNDDNGIDIRCGNDMVYLGPNDSVATIRRLAGENSEPTIFIVRNMDSDEPVCEPIRVLSSRKVNSKVLIEIQKVEKKGNLVKENDLNIQQVSKNAFPNMCVADRIRFQCVLCSLECVNRKALIEHVKSHSTDKKSFECPTCSKTFTQQCNLIRHIRCHSGERPFSCPHCEKVFADQGYLSTHLRYHTNTRPYTCRHCGKAFFDRSNYIKHLKSHSGERPYRCHTCGKSFLQQSDLTRHVRVHSGERPFKCGCCERSFTQHGDLTTHLRHHTGERPFACSDCKKTFANKRYLNSHVRRRVCFKKKASAILKETKLITSMFFTKTCHLKSV